MTQLRRVLTALGCVRPTGAQASEFSDWIVETFKSSEAEARLHEFCINWPIDDRKLTIDGTEDSGCHLTVVGSQQIMEATENRLVPGNLERFKKAQLLMLGQCASCAFVVTDLRHPIGDVLGIIDFDRMCHEPDLPLRECCDAIEGDVVQFLRLAKSDPLNELFGIPLDYDNDAFED